MNPYSSHGVEGRVCAIFGVDAFADEGLLNHSVRTAIINRQGSLVANIEGNQFTAAQLKRPPRNDLEPLSS